MFLALGIITYLCSEDRDVGCPLAAQSKLDLYTLYIPW